jgi:hypothetical protein
MVSTLNVRQRKSTLVILVGAWLVMVVPMAAAQEVDSRWAPWIGCWRAVGETVPASAPATAPLLCVVPLAGEAAIEMLTVVDGQVVSRESVFTDAQQHAVSREECEGWETAEFSDDSRRIYVGSELLCGTGGLRTSTGVMSMVSPSEWLDVRTVKVDGQSFPWVLRYRLAPRADFQAAGQGDLIAAQGSDVRMARMTASLPIALSDVIEAVGKVSEETLEVWVVERAEPFALDADRLIEMADAGVPASVIDVVVAVSYPEKFVVNERDPGLRREEARGGSRRSGLGYGRSINPFTDPFYDPYARYGYYSPYGYGSRYGPGYYGGYGYGGIGYSYGGYGFGGYNSGFGGYGFGGYNSGFGGYGNRIIVVNRRGSGAGENVTGSTRGQVVRGGGYTSAGSGGASTGRSAQPRSSGSSGSAASSRGSSGRSSASPARGSSTSSPQSTPRRAQPRPRGGN